MNKNNSKPALVFVHGYLGGSLQWQDQVDFFSKNYNVITPELPGYGLSNQQRSPESITGYAEFVLSELDNLNIEEFHLLGHSMGGMIAQEITVLAPQRVKKLILYGTGPIGIMPGRFESMETSKQRLQDEGIESNAIRISAKWFVDGKDCCNYQACADIALQASPQAALAGLTAMEGWSGTDSLASISSPTLVLWGDQDQSYQWELPEKLWREIPDC